MQGSDAELLAAGSDVLGSQHGGVGGGLVTVGLDLHATGDTADGLAATGITHVSHSCTIKDAVPMSKASEEGPFRFLHLRAVSIAVLPFLSLSFDMVTSREEAGYIYLRSVTWTKVSLKEAKIRATPKTSSPVLRSC